jgi:hypothetical protein
VAVLAVLLWGGMMGWRSFDYGWRAREYGRLEQGWRSIAARRLRNKDRSQCLQCAEYYAALVRRYRRAMWQPWLPIGPDPHAPIFR